MLKIFETVSKYQFIVRFCLICRIQKFIYAFFLFQLSEFTPKLGVFLLTSPPPPISLQASTVIRISVHVLISGNVLCLFRPKINILWTIFKGTMKCCIVIVLGYTITFNYLTYTGRYLYITQNLGDIPVQSL